MGQKAIVAKLFQFGSDKLEIASLMRVEQWACDIYIFDRAFKLTYLV